MRPLLEIWMASEALILVAAVVTLFVPNGAGRRPIWLGAAFLMVMIAGGALNAADKHSGEAGTEMLSYGAVFLYGVAFALGMTALRDRLASRRAAA
jgi:hypothetical protein